MPVSYSSRAQSISPFLAMEVMERGMVMARSGVDVVQLGVGEPGFPPPPEVVEAVAGSVRAGHTHYTDSRGLYPLREAIAADCERRRGVAVDPEHILVTSGSSAALLLVFNLLLDPGDEIIMPTPHYPCYPNMVAVCGGRCVLVPTSPVDGYRIDVDRVRSAMTRRTKGILVASPANPTGAVQPPEVMRALSELGVPVLSDEVYDGLLYDGVTNTSPLGLSDNCFVFDGFSKRYAMTGFRLGYVIAPQSAMRALVCLQQNLFISTAHFVQTVGLTALEYGGAHLEMMRQEYARRRRLLVDAVRGLGLAVPVTPAGAFYVLADARHLTPTHDSLALAFDILERAHVALGPGRDFGDISEGFLRFSFAVDYDDIARAIERLARVLPEMAAEVR
ncbi:MAG: aminotransferase class I/II-fold pyridoxal phosphate-dependent enzyme [Acidobacteria bacterium]|nr:aminotransferase class I/II-fold pyridoxal phosphate-dependent enzyme [Acidobacteriota bacterium]